MGDLNTRSTGNFDLSGLITSGCNTYCNAIIPRETCGILMRFLRLIVATQRLFHVFVQVLFATNHPYIVVLRMMLYTVIVRDATLGQNFFEGLTFSFQCQITRWIFLDWLNSTFISYNLGSFIVASVEILLSWWNMIRCAMLKHFTFHTQDTF
ncbi:hypothetical protein LOAG_01339 [Loa loa]|uniref:Uncharacterized protein n=1 Tax=Loa loa TaxID=7209 RepID=A0A1S0U9N2_LOALO|nr:hypothetical protein LOAG_01339 [Loa loa]EFO27149.1 hypothetical protein LOAG_01339 [Loa loa]